MNTRRKSTISPKTQEMVLTAILLAIALIMAFTPLGYPMIAGLFEIALIIIPVAIGSVVMGWKAGLILGAVFGISLACSSKYSFNVFVSAKSVSYSYSLYYSQNCLRRYACNNL